MVLIREDERPRWTFDGSRAAAEYLGAIVAGSGHPGSYHTRVVLGVVVVLAVLVAPGGRVARVVLVRLVVLARVELLDLDLLVGCVVPEVLGGLAALVVWVASAVLVVMHWPTDPRRLMHPAQDCSGLGAVYSGTFLLSCSLGNLTVAPSCIIACDNSSAAAVTGSPTASISPTSIIAHRGTATEDCVEATPGSYLGQATPSSMRGRSGGWPVGRSPRRPGGRGAGRADGGQAVGVYDVLASPRRARLRQRAFAGRYTER